MRKYVFPAASSGARWERSSSPARHGARLAWQTRLAGRCEGALASNSGPGVGNRRTSFLPSNETTAFPLGGHSLWRGM
jgi:hypothetical protein